MTELEQTIIEKTRKHLANLLLTDTTEKSAEKTLSFIRTSGAMFALIDLATAPDSGLSDQAIRMLLELEEQYMERFAYARDDDSSEGLPLDALPLLIYADPVLPLLDAVHVLENERDERWEAACSALVEALTDVVLTERAEQHRRITGY